jgi:23S rRNA (guanosine2251-2'-O)-methyltransferase
MRHGGQRRYPPRAPRPASDAPVLPEGRLVLGLQPVREAIKIHGSALTAVALDSRDSPRLEALQRFARDHGVSRVERWPRERLDRASAGVSHQGAAAWAPSLSLLGLEELLADPNLIALALDKIQDPQNFGAVVRSAVGVAEAAVIWGEHAAAPLSTAMVRASAGAVEHARLCRVASLVNALAQARESGIQVVGLDAQAPRALSEIDLKRPTVLVIGAEHSGLGGAVRRACSELARLVPTRKIDSLNASVAAGMALYEAAVQRMKIST